MTTSADDSPVWFISGCSSGLGRELARAVLARGWRVAASARQRARVVDLVQDHAAMALALEMDVTQPRQIADAVRAAEQRFGRIDVLVNNAGYGYQSTVEEGDEAEIRAQFDANVFGLFALTRAVLPGMRARRRGHVINISSVAGLAGYPGSGYYAASKHAVEGFSDALAAEGQALGIRVTCVEPGPFRTDWAGRSLRRTPSRIADYADSAGARMARTTADNGTQAGDPVRAAEAMISITEVDPAPRHLVLGAFGIKAVRGRLQRTLADLEQWQALSLAADFPKE